MLPLPTAESDKYARGVVGVLAGSATYTGAAVLAVGGALRGGAGMVRAVTAEPRSRVVRHAWPEAVVTELDGDDDPREAGRVQAWVAGPGIGTDAVAEAAWTRSWPPTCRCWSTPTGSRCSPIATRWPLERRRQRS